MSDVRHLRADARKFVTSALTGVSGRKPSERTITATVDRIVRALEPVVSSNQMVSSRKLNSAK